MVATETPPGTLGWTAPGFDLPGVDGRRWRLADARGPAGTLVMFICNHCPYVLAVLDRIVRDARDLQALGVGVIAIMPNDTGAYPQDSFANMQRLAGERDFPFPYLIDETQAVARAYDAVCTPDFFGFDAALALAYRGRLDESRSSAAPDARRDLFEAMSAVARGDPPPTLQHPSIGCSIKWRDG